MSGYVFCAITDCFGELVGYAGDRCDDCIENECEDLCYCPDGTVEFADEELFF